MGITNPKFVYIVEIFVRPDGPSTITGAYVYRHHAEERAREINTSLSPFHARVVKETLAWDGPIPSAHQMEVSRV